MREIRPAVERLVRLMILLPSDQHHEVNEGIADDCADRKTRALARNLRWQVGNAARRSSPATGRGLAEDVLTVFAAPSEATLMLIGNVITGTGTAAGAGAGQAWVDQVRAAAVNVLAYDRSTEDVLDEVAEEWTLSRR